jgi:hypothetical protein
MFYRLNTSVNHDEIGSYPQIEEIDKSEQYDFREPYSIRNIIEVEQPLIGVKFPRFKMKAKAKATDILSNVIAGYKFLTISKRAFLAISDLSLGRFQVFDVSIIHRKKVLDYHALYLIGFQDGFVDWEKCKFGVADWRTYYDRQEWIYLEYPKINSYREYHNYINNLVKKDKNFTLKTIQVQYTYSSDFDLFRVRLPGYVIYACSGYFKTIVEREGLTGFQFEALPYSQKVD